MTTMAMTTTYHLPLETPILLQRRRRRPPPPSLPPLLPNLRIAPCHASEREPVTAKEEHPLWLRHDCGYALTHSAVPFIVDTAKRSPCNVRELLSRRTTWTLEIGRRSPLKTVGGCTTSSHCLTISIHFMATVTQGASVFEPILNFATYASYTDLGAASSCIGPDIAGMTY